MIPVPKLSATPFEHLFGRQSGLCRGPGRRSRQPASQGSREAHGVRFLEALRSTCAEWALLSDSAEALLSKSAGEIGPM
jgi:hypothetical protein